MANLDLRPSRLPLLWLVPLVLVSIAVTAIQVSTFVPHIIGYGLLLLVLIPRSIAYAALLLRGRTVADADGIRNRIVGEYSRIRWSDVDYFKVQPTLFGRSIIGRLAGSRKRTFKLAAPRHGLAAPSPEFDSEIDQLCRLGAPARGQAISVFRASANPIRIIYALLIALVVIVFLIVDRPWLDPWWHGEALGVPDACSQSNKVTADMRVTQRLHDSTESTCLWTADGSRLRLSYKLNQRSLQKSGSANAHESWVDDARGFLAANPAVENELGDEARSSATADRGMPQLRVIARQANVTIEITYAANGPMRTVKAGALNVTRTAIGQIHLT